jgi:hypothetical protein
MENEIGQELHVLLQLTFQRADFLFHFQLELNVANIAVVSHSLIEKRDKCTRLLL